MDHGLTRVGIIDAYYWRRVAPLVARSLPIFWMSGYPDLGLVQRCLLTPSYPRPEEIRARFTEILNRREPRVVPVQGQPFMLPNPIAVGFVSRPSSFASHSLTRS